MINDTSMDDQELGLVYQKSSLGHLLPGTRRMEFKSFFVVYTSVLERNYQINVAKL